MSVATPSRRRPAAIRCASPSARSPRGITTTDGDSARRRVDHHRQPLDPGGPADSRRVRTAERFHQSVVAAARDDRALRAEPVGDEFERGVAVIIEAAHEARRCASTERRPRRCPR